MLIVTVAEDFTKINQLTL